MHMKFNLYAVAAFLLLAPAVRAQTTAFTYQGQLNSSNAPATGSYDFRFQIYNANNSVVAAPLTNAPVGVTNGLFTVTLDFGANFDGSTRSLEIGVRSFIASNNININTNAYTVLSPRQTLTSVPYAIQAINASNAVALTAPLPATNLAGTIPNSLLSPNVAILTNNVVFSGNVTAVSFTGSGNGLSSVPGTTRDTVDTLVERGGQRYHFVDTAGLRATDDPVEKIGVDLAHQSIESADAVLLEPLHERRFRVACRRRRVVSLGVEPDHRHVVAVVVVVHRIGLGLAHDAAVGDVRFPNEADGGDLALRERDQLGVRHVP